MRDPYSEDELRDAEMARIRARLTELEQPPGSDPPPAELEELLNSSAAWRTGRVPLGEGRHLLMTFGGAAGMTTTADVLGFVQGPLAATGRIGPVTRRTLPPPLAGYAEGGNVVLADWLGKGDARRVLRALRDGHPEGRRTQRGEHRLWGLAILPALLTLRSLRDLGLSGILTPVTGSASTAGTAMGAVAPLATAAAIATGPAVLPAVEAAFAPPPRRDVVAARIMAADREPLPAHALTLPRLPEPKPEVGERETVPEAAPPPEPAPATVPTAPAAEPTTTPTAEPSTPASPAPSPAPTTEPTAKPSAPPPSSPPTSPATEAAPAPDASADPPAEPATEPATEPSPEPSPEPEPSPLAVRQYEQDSPPVCEQPASRPATDPRPAPRAHPEE